MPERSAPLFGSGPRRRDEDGREELFRRYLPLAHGLALRFRNSSESVEDLCQVASIGLLQAIDRYDPTREDAFSSLSLATVLGELRRYLRDHTRSVHTSRDLQELSRRMVPTTEELGVRLCRSPTVVEIAAALDVSSEQMLDARQALAAQQSRVTR
jgi:RNA polymerase sigma-B factor